MKNASELDAPTGPEGKRFYVYELRDDTGKVFYVGKGSGKRVKQHRRAAEKGVKLYVYNKIRNLWNQGRDFESVIVFETRDETEAHAEEIRLISFYGRDRLCNLTDGGEGGSGIKVSENARRKRSDARKGVAFTDEIRERISRSKLKERFITDEALEDIKARRQQGETYKSIAKSYNVALATIHRRVNPRSFRRLNNPGDFNIQPRNRVTSEIAYEIRCEYASGSIMQAIADKYHLSITTIHSIVRGNSWKHVRFPEVKKPRPKRDRNPNAKLNRDQVMEMKDFYASGESFSDIARIYNVTVTCAHAAILGRTWSDLPNVDYSKRVSKGHTQTHRHGVENHMAILNEEKVVQMRNLRLGGKSYTEIAERFGVKTATAEYAINGRTWKHVPVPDGMDFSGKTVGLTRTRSGNMMAGKMAHGEKHCFAKLTEAGVIELRRLHLAGGWSYKELGEMFGVSSGVAWDADTGKTWNHVPYPEGHKLATKPRFDAE